MRLPVLPDLHINKFSGATITEMEAGMTNAVGEKRNGITYLTQRPPIDLFDDASATISDARGRAAYYWDTASALYILNADTIYKGSYSTSLSTSPTTGTKKCKFIEVGSLLVLLDAENNEGWTITTGGSVAAIASNFPATLAYGGVSMDTYAFVLDEAGTVYNSGSNDPATWGALDFVNAARNPDGGSYLAKHHDNLVIMGPSSIEYAWNAGNPTGSTLSIRQDIQHNIGCSSGESVFEEGDRLFWIGPNATGSLSVYTMINFQINKISTSTMDSFITQAIVRDDYFAVGSGLSGQGHVYYTLTLYTTPSDIVPAITLVYDDLTGLWGPWTTTVSDHTLFPLVAWSKREGISERFGEGIMSNGDLISVNDSLNSQDTYQGATYVTTDYVQSGYVQKTADTGVVIDMVSRLGMYDGGTNKFKYQTEYRHVGDTTDASQTLTLKWSDENNSSFTTGKTTDTTKYQKMTRCGRYRRRNHELSYSGTERIRIEALEGEAEVGNN